MPYYDYDDNWGVAGWPIVLFTLYILSVVLCIYSFVTANANNGKYIGTLLSAHVTQYDSNYYVVETFAKGLIDGLPSNNTCGIRRLHAYSDYMYASNMADAVVIGTTRQIWESYNDPGRCYDASLHNFWNTVGGLSIIIVGLPFVIIIIILLFEYVQWIWTQPSPYSLPRANPNRYNESQIV